MIAKNASKTAPYVLRLVAGSGGARNRIDVWQASDLICDEQVHELRQDRLLRCAADAKRESLRANVVTPSERRAPLAAPFAPLSMECRDELPRAHPADSHPH